MLFCVLFYFFVFTKCAFAATDDLYEARLIIGSGKNVINLYPFARKLTNSDITIDTNKKINPSHVLDIKDSQAFHDLSIKYKNKFDKIIFEHVEEVFASIVKNKKELNALILSCQRMLKNNGSIIFESSRHTSYTSDKYGNKIDFGPFSIIDKNYYPLKMIYDDSKVDALLNQKFNFIKKNMSNYLISTSLKLLLF